MTLDDDAELLAFTLLELRDRLDESIEHDPAFGHQRAEKEAKLGPLRVARAATGRSKILKFEGCYHGHADAMLLKAGSDLVFQMHYTANGTAGTDQSKVGMVFAKEPVKQRVHMLQVQNGRFTIPAGADNFPVKAAITLGTDVELLDLQPHMHVRGKTAQMKAIYPTGEEEKLLTMNWDFNWQLAYEYAPGKILPKGTRIEGLNTYDNSPNNKYNPDPKVDVKWGDQSWEEMMINFFRVAVNVDVKPGSLIQRTPPPAKPAAE